MGIALRLQFITTRREPGQELLQLFPHPDDLLELLGRLHIVRIVGKALQHVAVAPAGPSPLLLQPGFDEAPGG